MMNITRRGFLKGMMAAPAAVVVARVAQRSEQGINALTLPHVVGSNPTPSLPKQMWPGIEQWYSRHHALGKSMARTKDKVATNVLRSHFT
jgi:hypothetical protein